MNKKIQLIFTIMIIPMIIIAANEETEEPIFVGPYKITSDFTHGGVKRTNISLDTVADMQSMGYGPYPQEVKKIKDRIGSSSQSFISVPTQDYVDYMKKTTSGKNWVEVSSDIAILAQIEANKSNKQIPFASTNNGVKILEDDYNKYYLKQPVATEVPRKKMVAVPKSVVDEIAKKRAAENKGVNFEIDGNNKYSVPEEDYNKYYYNQLPFYQRWVQNIASLFTQRPSSSSSSGVLKSYASVPMQTTKQTPRFTQSFQQKLQSARQAAATSARKTAERMAMPSQEVKQLPLMEGLSESEILGAQPRYRFSIESGGFIDRLRQRWNKFHPA